MNEVSRKVSSKYEWSSLISSKYMHVGEDNSENMLI